MQNERNYNSELLSSDEFDLDSNAVQVFVDSQKNGFANSLRSFTIPFFPCDRDKIGKVEDKVDENGVVIKKASHVYVMEHRNLVIRYHAVPIQTSNNEEEFYFASTNEELIFQSIIEMVGTGDAHLKMEDSNNFMVSFRIQALRDYLQNIGKKRSGKQINKCIEILERSTVDVIYSHSSQASEKLKMSGTYLQSASRIISDDPTKHGMYQARLHPHFARDIILGDYRFIEHDFLNAYGKSKKLFNAILHILRHEFTNASAKESEQRKKHTFYLSDIFFSAGFRPNFNQATARRNIMEIKDLLMTAKVIEDASGFTASKMYDNERGVIDFICKITPTIDWGRSQRKDNDKKNRTVRRLEALAKKLPRLAN